MFLNLNFLFGYCFFVGTIITWKLHTWWCKKLPKNHPSSLFSFLLNISFHSRKYPLRKTWYWGSVKFSPSLLVQNQTFAFEWTEHATCKNFQKAWTLQDFVLVNRYRTVLICASDWSLYLKSADIKTLPSYESMNHAEKLKHGWYFSF